MVRSLAAAASGPSLGVVGSTAAAAAAAQPAVVFDGLPFPTVPYVAVCLAALAVPVLARLAGSSSTSLPAKRLLWAAAFGVNVLSVGQPGRFDGLAVAAAKNKSTDPNLKYQGGIPWTPVFAPAGWAFAIWGVIYLGELLTTVSVSVFGISPILSSSQSETSAALQGWVAGNLFQSLWCASFRPEFSDHLYLPATLLALAAASILGCHGAITAAIDKAQGVGAKAVLCALRFPLSLHGAWLCAACLLNLNGWAARSKLGMGTQVSLAYATAYAASAVGAALSLWRGDPFLALTIAWALKAVAAQTMSASAAAVLKLPDVAKESLAQTESALASVLIALAAVGTPFFRRELRRFEL